MAGSVGESAQQLVLTGSLFLAAPVALAAGTLSFFSPCCLPLVPGYLAFVSGSVGADGVADAANAAGGADRGDTTSATSSGTRTATLTKPLQAKGRTVTGAALFVLGFALVFTSYGLAFGGLGWLLQSHQQTLTQILGGLTIVLGLLFAGVFTRLPWASRSVKLRYRAPMGLAGAPLLGALFGLGWTPCIGPTLGAVLTLAATTGGAWRGALLAFTYSLGLGIPFILAAVSAQRSMTAFSWPRRHAGALMRAGGAVLVGVGLLQVTGAWSAIVSNLQGVIGGWTLPL